MTRFSLILLVIALAGCAEKPAKYDAAGWAAATIKPTDKAPKACDRAKAPPVPAKGPQSDVDAPRYESALLDWGSGLMKEHDVCGAWARGQR